MALAIGSLFVVISQIRYAGCDPAGLHWNQLRMGMTPLKACGSGEMRSSYEE